AVSSSTPMTRPRPYVSWVTWSCTANWSAGGAAGGALKGLVGRKRWGAGRAGFIIGIICLVLIPPAPPAADGPPPAPRAPGTPPRPAGPPWRSGRPAAHTAQLAAAGQGNEPATRSVCAQRSSCWPWSQARDRVTRISSARQISGDSSVAAASLTRAALAVV